MTDTRFDEDPCYCWECMIERTVLATTARIAERLPHLPETDLAAIDSEVQALVIHLSYTQQDWESRAHEATRESQSRADPDDLPW